MLLFGTGGHSNVIMEGLLAQGDQVVAVFDDESNAEFNGLIAQSYDSDTSSEDLLIVGIGNNNSRMTKAIEITHQFGQFVHLNSFVAHTATLGEGSVVFVGAVVNSQTIVGAHCIINTLACVDHNCRLDDFVHVAPNATLCGNVKIGKGTLIGAGAVVVRICP